MDAATQVLAGTNYLLTLEVSALAGAACDQVETSICSSVVVFRPLAVACQGGVSSCDLLSRPEGIKCMPGNTRGKRELVCFAFVTHEKLNFKQNPNS